MTRSQDPVDTKPAPRKLLRDRPAAIAAGPHVAWATHLVLALLALWPTIALVGAIQSPDFLPSAATVVVVFNALILMVLAIVAAQPTERRTNLTLATVACFAVFFAGDLLLGRKNRGLQSIAETYLVRPAVQRETLTGRLLLPAAIDRLPPVDRRSEADLRKVLTYYSPHPPKMSNISLLLPAIDAGYLPPFLPLSWTADAIVPGCNEGDQRQFPIFRTDRYGFNNEDWVYLWDREKTMLVGDSFAVGECVHQEQTVQGVMRRSGLAAYSTGISGHGPLLALAALTEYGNALRPRSVFWLYFDGNDLLDLRNVELQSPFLLQYLNDRFTQRLAERQGEVDRFWGALAKDGWAKLPQLQEQVRADPRALTQELLRANLAIVRRDLNLPDLASLTADADVVRVFKSILLAAERRVRSWGGDLYFVMIPNQDDYRGKVPPYRRSVLDAVQAIGLPTIDFDRPIRASGDPMQFFPLRTNWGHFNQEGYRLFAHSLIEAMIEHRQRLGDPLPLEELDRHNRRLARVNSLISALRRLNPSLSSSALLPLIRGQAIHSQHYDYRPYVGVSKVLEDEGRATVESGVAMFGITIQPKEPGNLLRVRVRVHGYSESDNRLALALFMDADSKPSAIASRPMPAKSASIAELEYEMLLGNLSPRAIQIRIGPASPGHIFINGDAKGANDNGPPSFIEITESRPVGD
jgi:hypothetical protein